MDERRIQFRVGVLVLGMLVMVVLLIILFGEQPVFRDQRTMYIRFSDAPGVNVDSPVRKSGILVGRVANVELLKPDGVLVTIRIDDRYDIRRDQICRINTTAILGDSTLEFVKGEELVGEDEYYQDQDYLEGMVRQGPLSAIDSVQKALSVFVNLEGQMQTALQTIQQAGQNVGSVAQSLNSVVDNNKDQLHRILQRSESAMDRMDRAMAAVDQFLGDDEIRAKLEEALVQIPDVLLNAGEVMSSLQAVAGSAERNLENLEGLTEPLGAQGERLTASIEQSLARFDALMGEMVTFSRSLNSSDNTMGMLLHDRELYDQIRSTAANIELLTKQLRPIVNNARVFTDKIARDPGRIIGLKGMFDNRQSGGKY